MIPWSLVVPLLVNAPYDNIDITVKILFGVVKMHIFWIYYMIDCEVNVNRWILGNGVWYEGDKNGWNRETD